MSNAQPGAHGDAGDQAAQPPQYYVQPPQYVQPVLPQYPQNEYPQNAQPVPPQFVQYPQGARPVSGWPSHSQQQYPQYPPAVPRYMQSPRRRMHPLRAWGIVGVVLGVISGLVGCFIMILPYGLFILAGGGSVDAFEEFAASFVPPGIITLVIGFILLVLGIVGIVVGKSRVR